MMGINGNGCFRKHKPCGAGVQVPLPDYLKHLEQVRQAKQMEDGDTDDDDDDDDDDEHKKADDGGGDEGDNNIVIDEQGHAQKGVQGKKKKKRKNNRNKKKLRSNELEKWARDAAQLINKLDNMVDQTDYENNKYSTTEPNSEYSEYFDKLLELTPPGSKQRCRHERGEYEKGTGLPVGYYSYEVRDDPSSSRKGTEDQTKANKMMQVISTVAFGHGRLSEVPKRLNSNGIADMGKPQVRESLSNKFVQRPAQPDDEVEVLYPEWLEMRAEQLGGADLDPKQYKAIDPEYVRMLVGRKKRGSGKDLFGYSFDNIKDLIRIKPEILEPMCRIMSYISTGILGPSVRRKIVGRSGTVLKKKADPNNHDVRPVGTGNPFLSIAANVANRDTADIVKAICGPTQLGGNVSGGGEVMVHMTRILLTANPHWVAKTRDAENAWGRLRNKLVIKVVCQSGGKLAGSSMAAMVDFEMGDPHNPVEIVFNDEKQGITIVHTLDDGVVQGGNMAGAVYNVVQSLIVNHTFEDDIQGMHISSTLMT